MNSRSNGRNESSYPRELFPGSGAQRARHDGEVDAARATEAAVALFECSLGQPSDLPVVPDRPADHDHVVGAEIDRGLDRAVQARPGVGVMAAGGSRSGHLDGREQGRQELGQCPNLVGPARSPPGKTTATDTPSVTPPRQSYRACAGILSWRVTLCRIMLTAGAAGTTAICPNRASRLWTRGPSRHVRCAGAASARPPAVRTGSAPGCPETERGPASPDAGRGRGRRPVPPGGRAAPERAPCRTDPR
jgi:hypothetical protein